ncbi:MAG: hypothetical protein ABI830_04280, partial [Pseudolabrys sp.]
VERVEHKAKTSERRIRVAHVTRNEPRKVRHANRDRDITASISRKKTKTKTAGAGDWNWFQR